MIARFEQPFHVRAQIEALNRELRGHIRNERHRDQIKASLAVFEKELARMVKEGVEDEPESGNKAFGTLAWHGDLGHQDPPSRRR
jgi:hypothetical protein